MTTMSSRKPPSYYFAPQLLGAEGRRVSCSVCKNTWFQRLDRLSELNVEKQTLEDYPAEKIASFQTTGNRPSYGNSGGGRNQHRVGSNYTAFVGNLTFSTTKEDVSKAVRPVLCLQSFISPPPLSPRFSSFPSPFVFSPNL